jgi:DDE superfamily endonuclease
LAYSKGRCHDFRLFKESNVKLHPDTQAIIDSGYLGLQKHHSNTNISKKRRKKKPLTKADKHHNRSIAQQRVRIENVIACLKRFKIISDRYRNRRKRLGLRFTLIAALYNKELNI